MGDNKGTSVDGENPQLLEDAIGDFFKSYPTRRLHYRDLAAIGHKDCKKMLRDTGIKGIVTYRAKSLKSIKANLKDSKTKDSWIRGIKDEAGIYNNIRDLAGVRIALYFPGDISKDRERNSASLPNRRQSQS